MDKSELAPVSAPCLAPPMATTAPRWIVIRNEIIATAKDAGFDVQVDHKVYQRRALAIVFVNLVGDGGPWFKAEYRADPVSEFPEEVLRERAYAKALEFLPAQIQYRKD